MKKVMKVAKPLSSMKICFEIGELVETEATGKLFKITPVGKKGPSISGVPQHYLEEVSAA